MPFKATVKPLTFPVTAFINPDSGALMLPNNIPSNSSLDGIWANCITFCSLKNCPSNTPPFAPSSSVSFCTSFTSLAGAVGSSSKYITAVAQKKLKG